jgi:hypothetical protein
MTTGGAAASTAAAAHVAATAKLGATAWSLVALATLAIGAGGYAAVRFSARGHDTVDVGSAATAPSEAQQREPTPPPLATDRPVLAAATVADAGTSESATCPSQASADAPARACSHKGGSVAMDFRNACTHDVDLFWVDYRCEEVFHARLAPGESFMRVTQDGHVWRVRDHATRAILKEFVPQRAPGLPDVAHDAAPRPVAEVVIGPDAKVQVDDAPPPVCSGAGAPAKLKIKNERADAVSVMWVGLDCKEKYWERIEPHKALEIKGRDTDAWRIRDAKTGGVVFDIAPEAPDRMTYVTVP